MNSIYVGDRQLDDNESDYECPGCGMQFNGWGTLSHHTARCVKALLLSEEDSDGPDPDL